MSLSVRSIAILAAALEGGALTSRPAFVAGHSLGQFTALVAALEPSLADRCGAAGGDSM